MLMSLHHASWQTTKIPKWQRKQRCWYGVCNHHKKGWQVTWLQMHIAIGLSCRWCLRHDRTASFLKEVLQTWYSSHARCAQICSCKALTTEAISCTLQELLLLLSWSEMEVMLRPRKDLISSSHFGCYQVCSSSLIFVLPKKII